MNMKKIHATAIRAVALAAVFALLALPATPAPAAIEYVIEISVDGLGGPYLNNMFNGTATGGPYSIPNFNRLKNEGAGTLAAHIDNDNYETLPNHTSLVTARPQVGTAGHNWTGNGDPLVGQTLHSNKTNWLPGEPHYVASVFDVAHDAGLKTGMYANKTKFSLFDNTGTGDNRGGSYNATYGAPDTNPVGENNGQRKLDNTYINTNLTGLIASTYINHQKGVGGATPNNFALLHFNNPDAAGHGPGWGSETYYQSVVTVDGFLGQIFNLIENEVPAMKDKTAIILTADHGYQGAPGANTYSVPFYVWGPGVTADADLYALNSGNRQVASSYPMTTYAGMQPIRNAEASNLALDLLGLDAIPGSAFNYSQDLVVPEPSTFVLIAAGLAGLLVGVWRRRQRA